MNQFNELMGKTKIIEILSLFINNPTTEFFQKHVIKKTNIAKATAVKWLDYLVSNKFIYLKKIGVTNIYTLNNENIIIKQLKITNTIIQLQELNKLENKNIEIYLYGSAARGEETEKSDIDILVLGKTKRSEIIGFFENLTKKLGKTINFRTFTQLEWAMMQKKDKAYYERVEKDKLRLV